MSKKRPSTFFSRLLFSVAIPEIIIFSLVATFSYIQLKEVFNEISAEKIENYEDELRSLIKLQDASLINVSYSIEHNAQSKMKDLRYNYFSQTDSIETADLDRIKKEIGMEESDEIYIINREGIIVNTTYPDDLNFNLYQLDDKKFTDFLKDMFNHDFYTPIPLSLEHSSRKFRKYVFQSTRDHKYVIELGFYLPETHNFNAEISRRLNEIEKEAQDIQSIDLIMAPWDPISFYSRENIDVQEANFIKEVFQKKKDTTIDIDPISYVYIYFQNVTKGANWVGVLKVEFDRTKSKEILMSTLIQKLSIFLFGVGILFTILFFNVKSVVRPLSHLSDAAKELGDGNLEKRAKAEGTREMIYMSESFNQMADKLEASYKEISRKNNEILASINYAKRIQEAILPPIEEIEEHLDDVFVFYRPKDIVAGDFYWFESIGDVIYIAAADCTGHGVPGAIVSVVCSNALDQAVKELGLTEPAEILNTVRRLVVSTFEKSHKDVKDGMDICFCKIEKKKKKVTYAGAMNSLYRVTAKKEEDQVDDKEVQDDDLILIEYKSDKQPIGKFEHQQDFRQTEINYESGDCFYLFSDGYPDQFGGEKMKKYMYKPFKKLLLKQSHLPMSSAENLLDKDLKDWMRDESQIDDICVIGIRLS